MCCGQLTSGFDVEHDRPFRARPVVRVDETIEESRVVFHDLRPTPDLDALLIRIVHEEDVGLIVLGQVPDADVLPVSGVVRKGERPVVRETVKNPLGPPRCSMWPARGARGPEVEGVPGGEKALQHG